MEQQMDIRKIIRGIAAGILMSTAVTMALIFIMALLMYVADVGSMGIKIGVHFIYIAAALAGGWIAGRKAGFKKFLWGLLSGFLYYLLVCVIAALSGGMDAHGFRIQTVPALICIGSGMLGGMLG
ncbi:MAG: TIGR04086 family membrane protein [Coprococcus sp.]